MTISSWPARVGQKVEGTESWSLALNPIPQHDVMTWPLPDGVLRLPVTEDVFAATKVGDIVSISVDPGWP